MKVAKILLNKWLIAFVSFVVATVAGVFVSQITYFYALQYKFSSNEQVNYVLLSSSNSNNQVSNTFEVTSLTNKTISYPIFVKKTSDTDAVLRVFVCVEKIKDGKIVEITENSASPYSVSLGSQTFTNGETVTSSSALNITDSEIDEDLCFNWKYCNKVIETNIPVQIFSSITFSNNASLETGEKYVVTINTEMVQKSTYSNAIWKTAPTQWWETVNA